MDPGLLEVARGAIGFMPDDEGRALYEAARQGARVGPLLEIGSYCGKSTVYLGAAARAEGGRVYSIDHHRGSEEHQAGEEYHDERLVRFGTHRVDTLPEFRATIARAGLSDVVVSIVARSEDVAAWWRMPLGLVLIDGGHSEAAASGDYEGWSPWIAPGGLLAIHDVFPDPADGGRPPYLIYLRALDSGDFEETSATGSLRVLRRMA